MERASMKCLNFQMNYLRNTRNKGEGETYLNSSV